MPGTTVEVAFELTVGDTPYFRLDDPVKGKLNNTSYRLAGPIWIDITDRVANVSIKRGKNRELERYNAGNASITLHNEDRTFDPLNMSSPYVGNIIPRRAVRVTTSGVPQFTGVIEDWNLDYDVGGKSNAQIVAADAFTLLAQQSLTAGTATVQTTGERVNAVLSMPSVAWPLTQRNIDTGSSQVGADVWTTDDNALTYLQEVEASEQGQLFMDRNGYVRFVNGAVTPTTQGSWVLSATNLVTNPSMETASGTVTVRTNLVTNPSSETAAMSTAGAGTATVAVSTTQKYVGTQSTKLTWVSGAVGLAPVPLFTATAGQVYTLSVYVFWESGEAPYLEVQNQSYGNIPGVSGVRTPTAMGSWQRLWATFTVPAGATGFRIYDLVTSASTYYMDAVLLEESSVVGDYFDGSTSASGDFSYAWSGTANASTSRQLGASVSSSVNYLNTSYQSRSQSYLGGDSLAIFYPLNSIGVTYFDHTVTANVTYTASAWVKGEAGKVGLLSIEERTSSAYVGNTDSAVTFTGSWQRVSVTRTFGSTGTVARVLFYNGTSTYSSQTIYVDALMLEASPVASTYFDGSLPATFTKRYGWNGTANASTSYEETADVIAYPAFSDEGDGIPYTSATISYGTELLYNQVKVTSPTATSIANNTASQALYGITTTDVETLLSTSNAVASLALFWVAKYGEPEYRFQDLEISLDGLSAADVETALNIELGDIVQIKFTPNGVGDSIQRYGQVNKIEHSITPDRHNIVFGFGSLQFSFLVLDDTGFGILNENVLAF